MKVQLIVQDAEKAYKAINILESEGISKNEIEISSPSTDQFNRVESEAKMGPMSPNPYWSLILPTLTMLALSFLALTATEVQISFESKILAVLICTLFGIFMGLVITKIKFSSLRRYKSVKINDSKMINRICLQFNAQAEKVESIKRELQSMKSVEMKLK